MNTVIVFLFGLIIGTFAFYLITSYYILPDQTATSYCTGKYGDAGYLEYRINFPWEYRPIQVCRNFITDKETFLEFKDGKWIELNLEPGDLIK